MIVYRSLLSFAHHAVRLWRSPRRWPRGATNPVQIRWKSHVSFPLSWGRWLSLIDGIAGYDATVQRFHRGSTVFLIVNIWMSTINTVQTSKFFFKIDLLCTRYKAHIVSGGASRTVGEIASDGELRHDSGPTPEQEWRPCLHPPPSLPSSPPQKLWTDMTYNSLKTTHSQAASAAKKLYFLTWLPH